MSRIYAGAMDQLVGQVPQHISRAGDVVNASQGAAARQLSVIVPTFNERDNVAVLFARLAETLEGISWEVIFVDDNSPDGTWQAV